jgi:hypothetical protein
MKEFKIIFSESEEFPFACYSRESSGILDFFGKEEWKLDYALKTHQESIDYCTCQNGKFLGTFTLDNKRINEIINFHYQHGGFQMFRKNN